MATLHWEIPKLEGEIQWSELFRKAQKIYETFSASNVDLPPGIETPRIKDYSITQNSLEHVFLRLAHLNTNDSTNASIQLNLTSNNVLDGYDHIV